MANIMIREKLKGTGTALVTPFDARGAIDFDALERLIEFNIEGGWTTLCPWEQLEKL